MQLKDQAAIVTGGASGLGASVTVYDLNPRLAETVAAEIGGFAAICDVSDAASAEAAIVKASKEHGPARILVNSVATLVIGREGRRLGQADEFASLALHMIDNPYLNGEMVRLDAALRMAPR